MNDDKVIFTRKNGEQVRVSDLYNTIYDNSENTKEEIRLLIQKLSEMTHTPAEAVALMSHVTEMIHANIKNDDILVKLAAIVTRAVARAKDPNSEQALMLTEEDIKQLQLEIRSSNGSIIE